MPKITAVLIPASNGKHAHLIDCKKLHDFGKMHDNEIHDLSAQRCGVGIWISIKKLKSTKYHEKLILKTQHIRRFFITNPMKLKFSKIT